MSVRLRTKILLYFGSFVLFSIVTFVTVNYVVIEGALHEAAHKQLRQRAQSVSKAVDTVLTGAVRSYLRGVVDQDVKLLEQLERKVRAGQLTRAEAEDVFQAHALTETLGKTGYVVAVETHGPRFELAIHPYTRGQDCTETKGCQIWVAEKEGYSEYPWKNPEDESFRQKVAYLRTFEPWNWVVGATSYEDEFLELVRVDDIREIIGPARVLDNGYFYVMDDRGQMLIHPEIEGDNFWDVPNADGIYIAREMLEHIDDFFYYRWQNPSDEAPRDKFMYVTKLEHLGWYVCASGYLEDIEVPIRRVMLVSYLAVVLTAVILLGLTVVFSRGLTRPLTSFLEGLSAFREERRVFRAPPRSVAELDSVGRTIENLSEELLTAEEANRALLAQLDGIVESMPSMLVALDADERVIVWNQKAEEFTGLGRDEAQGSLLSDVFSRFAALLAPIQESIAAGRPYAGSCEAPLAEGGIGHYEVTLFPLRAGLQNVVIRIDDVTERVGLEETLTRRGKVEALGTLAGGIAHDFNNILAAILGYAELVREQLPEGSDGREMQSQIVRAAERARELVRQILLFSRQTRQEARPVQLDRVLREALTLLRSSIPSTIAIEADMDADAGSVLADPTQMHQVIMNLCTNAYQVMRETGGVLRVSTSACDVAEGAERGGGEAVPPGRYVRITVVDTGHGMDAATRARIFDPFFTTKKTGEGTGMGLSVVLGIVESLGGHIRVESELGRGTTVEVFLPRSDMPPAPARPVLEAAASLEGSERILVVDDERMVLEVTRRGLELLGYAVSAYDDSREALAAFRAEPEAFDLVISDMTMPYLTGLELTRAILATREDTPVVICSGYNEQIQDDTAQEMGIVAYLHKPLRHADLVRVVRQVLDTRR